MDGQVTFGFKLPISVRQEDKWFYSSCPLLDVHSQGTSHQEAANNLTEALQLFIESCFERGTLDQVLQASGFRAGGQAVMNDAQEYLEVPVSLIARAHVENRPH